VNLIFPPINIAPSSTLIIFWVVVINHSFSRVELAQRWAMSKRSLLKFLRKTS